MTEYETIIKNLRACAAGSSQYACFKCPWVGNREGCITAMVTAAANAIEELQKLTDTQLDIIKQYQVYLTKQHWISVTERLPSDEKEYLAYYGFVLDGEMSEIRFIGAVEYFAFDNPPHWQHEDTGLTVTHWMPLPKPPEEVKK